jgi:plasmid stabilization system protein ParE
MAASTPRCDYLNAPSKRSRVWRCFLRAALHSQAAFRNLAGMRTKLVKDFPNHVVFYVEHKETIEVLRVLRGGQDMSVEIEKN